MNRGSWLLLDDDDSLTTTTDEEDNHVSHDDILLEYDSCMLVTIYFRSVFVHVSHDDILSKYARACLYLRWCARLLV